MSIRQGDTIISGLGTILPAQSGQNGKFLTTDGSIVSWGDVDTFPDQLGNSGKFLTTNGQAVSWATVTIPTVNNSTITIQKNGTTVDSFTTNASSGKTINITVPTTAADVSAVSANSAITGATKCKITYDSKGLVTAGANLSASDIPDISATYQTKLTSGTNIKTINSTSLLGSGDISITGLPSQSGNSGKYLTTNGTSASWATVPLPSIATTSTTGLVKPDGTTITITNDGTISAASGAYAMVIVDYTAEEE